MGNPVSRSTPTRAGTALTQGRLGESPRKGEFQSKVSSLPTGSFSIHRSAGGNPNEPKAISMSEKKHDKATDVVDDVFTSKPGEHGDLLPPEIQKLREELRAAGDEEGLEDLSALIVERAKADQEGGAPVYTPASAPQALPPGQLFLVSGVGQADRRQFIAEVINNSDLTGLSQDDINFLVNKSNEPGILPADVLKAFFKTKGAEEAGFDVNSLGAQGDHGLRDLYDMWCTSVLVSFSQAPKPVMTTYYQLKEKDGNGQVQWVSAENKKNYPDDAFERKVIGEKEVRVQNDPNNPKAGYKMEKQTEYGGVISKEDVKKDADGKDVVNEHAFAYDASAVTFTLETLMTKIRSGNLQGNTERTKELGQQQKTQNTKAAAGTPAQQNLANPSPPPAANPPAAAAPAAPGAQPPPDAPPAKETPSAGFVPRTFDEAEKIWGPAPRNIVALIGWIFGNAAAETQKKVEDAALGLVNITKDMEGQEEPDEATSKNFDVQMFALQGLQKQYELINTVGGSILNGMADSAKSIFRG